MCRNGLYKQYSALMTEVKALSKLMASLVSRLKQRQGSILSPLLFIIVMQAIREELGNDECTKEVLYADDLLIMARNINAATNRLEEGLKILEIHGLKINLEKTKYAESNFSEKCSPIVTTGRFPCSVYGKGVGRNFLR